MDLLAGMKRSAWLDYQNAIYPLYLEYWRTPADDQAKASTLLDRRPRQRILKQQKAPWYALAGLFDGKY